MARKKVIHWTGLIAALIFFGILGLWMGSSPGRAQLGPPPGCVTMRIEGCNSGDCDCGGGWIELDEVPSGAHNWRVALCVRQ